MRTFLILFILGCLVSCASNKEIILVDEKHPTEIPRGVR